MSDNKLVMLTDAATLTGFGWIARKTTKETFTGDPSSNVMNYMKITAIVVASIALKKYLEEKIFPSNL